MPMPPTPEEKRDTFAQTYAHIPANNTIFAVRVEVLSEQEMTDLVLLKREGETWIRLTESKSSHFLLSYPTDQLLTLTEEERLGLTVDPGSPSDSAIVRPIHTRHVTPWVPTGEVPVESLRELGPDDVYPPDFPEARPYPLTPSEQSLKEQFDADAERAYQERLDEARRLIHEDEIGRMGGGG